MLFLVVAKLTPIVCHGTLLLLSWNLTIDEKFGKTSVQVSILFMLRCATVR